MFNSNFLLMEAQTKLSDLYVYTPEHAYALEQLKRRAQLHMRTAKPVGFVLTGESRSGKSRIITEFKKWLAAEHPGPEPQSTPLLHVELPDNTSPKGLSGAILDAGGDVFAWNDSTKVSKDNRANLLIREKSVISIAFDEFHHLFDGKTTNGVKNATQAIKRYFNKLDSFIILSGLEKIVDYIVANDELRLRFRYCAKLPTYKMSDEDQIASFRLFLKKLAGIVPLHSDCHPENDVALLKMMIASGGVVGSVVDIYQEACNVAIGHDTPEIQNVNLAEAFSTTLECASGHYNPFDLTDKEIYRKSAKLLRKTWRSKVTTHKNPWSYGDAG